MPSPSTYIPVFTFLLATLPSGAGQAQVIINELHAAPSERLLRYDAAGQGRLGGGPSWWEASFDAASWATAPAPIGFAYPTLATDLGTALDNNTPSLYVRKTFAVPPGNLNGRPLSLTVDFNDAFVAYLNGREVARSNFGPAGLFIYADQTALVPRAAGEGPLTIVLGNASDLLLPGENILAFQVHNYDEDAKGNLRFDARLEVEDGWKSTVIFADDFNNSNGARRTHSNTSSTITNTTEGTPPAGSWLERARAAESSSTWTGLTIISELAETGGTANSGSLQHTFTATGPPGAAVLRGPEIDLSTVWQAGAVTEADLESLTFALDYKAPAGFSAGVALEAVGADPATALPLPAMPVDTGEPSPETIGFWRFEEAAAANGTSITTTASEVNAAVLGATGQSNARYSIDVPADRIFDPLSGHAWENRFSLNASAANSRLRIPNSALLNSESFTVEFFVKVMGEPLDSDPFLRRGTVTASDTAVSSTRRSWQVEFDSGSTRATYGRLRSRWDTPGVPPQDWNRIVLGGLVFADTASGDGLPGSYSATADPQSAGDGVNDVSVRKWHHIALTWDGTARRFRILTNYQPGPSQTLTGPFSHPSAALELGKFATNAYGLNFDELRYTGRVLAASELLRAVPPDAAGFRPYTGTVHATGSTGRTAFLTALNQAGATRVRPDIYLRPESVDAAGKTLVLDNVKVTDARPIPVVSIINTGDSWQYVTGAGEPSGGVWDPGLPRKANTQDQQFSVAAFPDIHSFSDWIELHNPSAAPVVLDGWTLSDDPGDPAPWAFPQGTTIAAGGYLVVLADDNDGIRGLQKLHTNFKLGGDGETLQLRHDGALVDQAVYPKQDAFHSYGRKGSEWAFLDLPTPGLANRPEGSSARVQDPEFSLPGGFYNNPETLTISTATEGAVIRYTTDGSEPTALNGLAYTAPLSLPKINEKTGWIIRARACLQGSADSGIRSATYLIGQHASLRTAPALTIAGDPRRDLYKPFGILSIEGGTVDGNNIWSAANAEDYNLPLFHGRAYERSVFVEWHQADGSPGFAEQAGLRVASSPHSRPRLKLSQTGLSPWTSTPFEKPSFNLFFRGEYGVTELDFPVLGQGYPVKSFDQLRARAGKNDIINPFIKDELIRRTFIDMGHPVVRGTFNTLYVNGAYKGYYNTVERYRAPFFQSHYNSQADWDIRINDNVEDGDTVEWTAMLEALGRDPTVEANFKNVLGKLDLDEVIDYFLINIYTAQSDWPNNNWVAARERAARGRYRLYLWDSEISFAQNAGKPVSFDTIQADLKSLAGSLPTLFRALYSSSEIRLRFADRIHRHFFNNGALDDRTGNASRIVRRKNELAAQINPLMQFTNAQTLNHAFLDTWVKPGSGRRRWLFDSAGTGSDVSFRKHGLWPRTEPPVLSQHGGTLAPGQSVTLTLPATVPAGSAIYYTLDGSDPRLFGGAVSPSALLAAGPVIPPSAPQIILSARIRNAVSQEWSPLTQASFLQEIQPASAANLVISQIQYHPPAPTAEESAAGFSDADDFEFLELQAVGSSNVDLSGLKFTAGISFDFASSPIKAIAAGGRVLVVKNRSAFRQRYGSGPGNHIAGEYLGKLDNSGERLQLTTTDGPDEGSGPDIVLDFSYGDDPPWPTAADGAGPTLSLRLPDTLPDHADPDNWSAGGPWAGAPVGSGSSQDWQAWQTAHFTAQQAANPAISGALADPDGDGTLNLLEFARGTRPGVADGDVFPIHSLEDVSGESWLTLSGDFSTARSGLEISAEASSDLSTWTPAMEITPAPAAGAESLPERIHRQWRDVSPRVPDLPRFMRIRVRLR